MSGKQKTSDVPVPETATPDDPRAVVYVVQARMADATAEQYEKAGLPEPKGEMPPCWIDIATVTVPARSHRRKVIGLALAQSGLRPEVGGDPLRLRVLDAASAHETVVTAKQAEPTLEF